MICFVILLSTVSPDSPYTRSGS